MLGDGVTTESLLDGLAGTARRLAGLADCRILLREGEDLVEPRAGRLRLALRASLSGTSLLRQQALVAPADDTRLAEAEQALLAARGASTWLAVPIPFAGEVRREGVAIGLTAAPATAGRSDLERGVLRLVAEQFALRCELASARQQVAAEQERSLRLEQGAEGLLHSLRCGVLLIRADGTLHDANRPAELLLGFDLASARGRPAAAVIGEPEVRRLVQCCDATYGRPPEVRLGERGEPVVEVTVHPVYDAAGELRQRVVVLDEITALRQADELKDQFVSTVSHELRTPLTTIKAFAATLLRAESNNPADYRGWLEIINHECDRLAALVNDLLTISRLESGRGSRLMIHTVTLVPLLRETAAMHLAAANRHTLELVGDEALTIQGDGVKLRQVFSNLLSNAIKYSPRGGTVRVAVSRSGGQVTVSVSDSGVGIRPEHLNRVFEKFYQVDASSTRRVGGSGLGLYLARRLVEAHGGRIWVESEPDAGATFHVSLPARGPAEGSRDE